MSEEVVSGEEHERAFFRAFVIREKRDRYLQMVGRYGRWREKLRDALPHELERDLRSDCLYVELPAAAAPLLARASRAWLVTYDRPAGRFEAPSEAAVELESAHFEGFASFVPGVLAMYRSELGPTVWLLRPPARR